jgi:CTP:molybdopterin cytidylyltransferase MocA
MNDQFSVAAVVTAGYSPKEDDLLAEYTQGKSKALIPIAGKPMIAHVVDALAGSRYVKHIAVVALDPEAEVQFSVPIDYVPDTGGMLSNVQAGVDHVLEHYPDVDAALLSGSDVPTITSAIVDAFIDECRLTDHEVYYAIVERSVMEARFPESRRTFIRLKDGEFAGGDVMLFRNSYSVSRRDLWERLSASRKNALRQVAMFGPWTLLKFVTRRLSLADAERRAREVLSVDGRAIAFPYAEVGMDVDKPSQLEIARTEIEARAGNRA